MKRLNLLPKKHHPITSHFATFEVSDRTQNAFLACAAAVALVSLVSFFETQRVVQAQFDSRQAATHLADVERRESDVRTVAQALASLGFVARNVEGVRVISHSRLATLARVGDVLPYGIWITDIASSQRRISLKGSARNAALLGEALRNLAKDHAFTQPQLVSAREHHGSASHFIDFEFSLGTGDKG